MSKLKIFEDFVKKNNFSRVIKAYENLSSYTSIKTGGEARFLCEPDNIKQVQSIFAFLCLENIPYKIIGNGSNLLISDNGYNGVVISLKRLKLIFERNNSIIIVTANYKNNEFLNDCILSGLGGVEFLSGIPGTIGGLVAMNAGAFGHSISEAIKEISILNKEGEVEKIPQNKIDFSYRCTKINRNNYIIIAAKFNLIKRSIGKVKALCKKYLEMRDSKYSINYPTFGSTFRNGDGYYAAELIEKCGLKGYRINDAEISEQHANFIINKGNASSEDIYKIIKTVQEKVKKRYQIELMPEVKLWGEFKQ